MENPTPKRHELKLGKPWFEAKLLGLKPWELRLTHDREFVVGDEVRFIEMENGKPTGRETGWQQITWVLHGRDERLNHGKENSPILGAQSCIFTHEDPRLRHAASELIDSFESVRDAMDECDPILEHYATVRLGMATTQLALALGRHDPSEDREEPSERISLAKRVVDFLRISAADETPAGALAASARAILREMGEKEGVEGIHNGF